MKKGIVSIFLLSIMLIFGGCNSTVKNSSNYLKVTKDDEKIILEYLDTKTNDISAPSGGKMYSAFDVLGTDDNKIYIWVVKEQFIKHDSEMIQGTGGVSLPVVLNIKTIDGKIKVIDHKSPRDGNEGAKDIKKLFPENVRNLMNKNNNERVTRLEEFIRNRAGRIKEGA